MVSGLILAGGQGSRLDGRDKGFVEIAGRPMIEHVLERFGPQVDILALSANRNIDRYKTYGHEVLSDDIDGFAGPLAGMLAGLKWCPGEALATAPCDSPALALDLVQRLETARRHAHGDIAFAIADSRPQPVFAVIAASLRDSLQEFLGRGERKIGLWYRQHSCVEVEFDDAAVAFQNVNTEAERRALEAHLQ